MISFIGFLALKYSLALHKYVSYINFGPLLFKSQLSHCLSNELELTSSSINQLNNNNNKRLVWTQLMA